MSMLNLILINIKYHGHEKAHFNLLFHTHVGGYGKGWNSYKNKK